MSTKLASSAISHNNQEIGKQTSIGLVITIVGLLELNSANAASVHGGTFIDIEDGSQHDCVNISNHLISMTLVQAQLQRSQNWWESFILSKAALGVKWDVNLEDESGKLFDFPRAKMLSVSATRSDIGLLPMTLPIMSKYRLVGADSVPYNNVSLDLYLVNIEKESVAFKDFTALANFSSSLPVPANPYITGVEYFGNFVQKIIDQNIQQGAQPQPDASFSFDLASNEEQVKSCPRQALREGVQAVIFDYDGTLDRQMIKAEESANYCFWYVSGTSRILFSSRPAGGSACAASPPGESKQLNNPLVAFLVSPWPVAGTSAASPSAVTSANKASPVDAKVAVGAIEQFAVASQRVLPAGTSLSGGKVAAVFNAATAKTSSTTGFAASVAEANPDEVAAALALKRCALVGISASACE
jgi:hypothetical protein